MEGPGAQFRCNYGPAGCIEFGLVYVFGDPVWRDIEMFIRWIRNAYIIFKDYAKQHPFFDRPKKIRASNQVNLLFSLHLTAKVTGSHLLTHLRSSG
ncbi:hypothetical protein M514_01499 [Trichuris suis]|uniref:Uncharacterized protein n=1 Tax=Trichuris suis TaxID=68888 RepID=A0A085MKT3_9BILA|nr:hypothetical protein M513_01499 [Trichuris suis]KFD69207.1 hypothetical protein M514_01499 [Trichuris suis]